MAKRRTTLATTHDSAAYFKLHGHAGRLDHRDQQGAVSAIALNGKANRVAAKKPPPSQVAAWSVARLLRDTVGPLAGLGLDGLNLQSTLLLDRREETPHPRPRPL